MPDACRHRRSLGSGQRLDAERLIRFVADPAGRLVPDPARRLPGRGLWIEPEAAAIAAAQAKRLFGRAARRPVSAPDNLARAARDAYRAHCADLESRARRAGPGAARLGHRLARDLACLSALEAGLRDG